MLALSLAEFGRPAIEAYGAIPRRDGGELALDVAIEEAHHDHDRVKATRRVTVTTVRSPLSDDGRRELARLEKEFQEDLRDFQGEARLLRAGRLAPALESQLRRVAFVDLGVRDLELLAPRVAPLEKKASRLRELRRLESQAAKLDAKDVTVPADSITDVARFGVAYRVALSGKTILEGRVESRDGLEQWEHAADPAAGVAAARYDERELAALVERARGRAVSRLAAAISRHSLFGAISEDEAVTLLVRIARATGSRDDRELLEWRLRKVHGLAETTVAGVVDVLLDPGR